MAFRKLVFLVSVFLPILLVKFALADPALLSEDAVLLQEQDDSASRSKAALLELQKLKSKISSLESSIEDQTSELRRKEGVIDQLEKIIKEKLNSLASLQTTVESLQGSLEMKERMGEVNTRVSELEKQIVNLKKDIEAQNKRKDVLEDQANVAEKKIEGLNLKLENLQKINHEQESRLLKMQRALQVAEEEMLKAKLKASSITKKLRKVRQGWLPPWLTAHLVHFESFVLTQWNEIGRPAFNLALQKARKQKYEVEKWMQPHLKTVKTKWFPTIKEWYDDIVDDVHPPVQSLLTQAIEYYHVTQSTIRPHMAKIQESMDPYLQETKKFIGPYVDQVSAITKPHLDKAHLFLKPYSKKAVHHCKQIAENILMCHSLIEATLHETLYSYKLTRPLVTECRVRFMANILMVLPGIVLIVLSLNNRQKHRHGTHRRHTRKRAKPVHPEK